MTVHFEALAVALGGCAAAHRFYLASRRRTASSFAFAGAALFGTAGAAAYFYRQGIDEAFPGAEYALLLELVAFATAATALTVYVGLLNPATPDAYPRRTTLTGAVAVLLICAGFAIDLGNAGTTSLRKVVVVSAYAYIITSLLRAGGTSVKLFRRHHQEAPGLAAIAAATVLASACFVAGGIAYVFRGTDSRLVEVLQAGRDLVSPPALALLGLGILSLGLWEAFTAAREAADTARRLEPLWDNLTTRYPVVVLPGREPRWWPAGIRYRAHRRATEIVDALGLLRLCPTEPPDIDDLAAAILAGTSSQSPTSRPAITFLPTEPGVRQSLLALADSYSRKAQPC